MTLAPPAYFALIQSEARRRWEQLEADPGLAAPWRQLFLQVRHDPRYVISELLQNADDVGASWAKVFFEDDTFIVEHNGRDFTGPEFASLCQFAFSSKRILHTIGYRGIGFKTTFSLSDRVELISPTLAVGFDAARFTEPIWLSDRQPSIETTRIEIEVKDRVKRKGLEDSLSLWAETGLSLLFFTSIQKLIIGSTTLVKTVVQAPLPAGMARVRLQAGEAPTFYLVTSEPHGFPDEAVQEIRSERQYADFDPPPVKLELVLGTPAPQRLYSVLPTQAYLELPFSCNAPFIQDPARTGIKSPSVSPTNRWLLEQIGRLAGRTLAAWLAHPEMELRERAQAYDLLLPEPQKRVANSLGDECTAVVIEGLSSEMAERSLLLCTDGELADTERCLELPAKLLKVWPTAQLLSIFGERQQKVLAGAVSQQARDRLVRWEKLQRTDRCDLIRSLINGTHPPPRPDTDEQLIELWSAIEEWIGACSYLVNYHPAIVPVMGDPLLRSADKLTVIGPSGDALSQDDWAFLSQYAQVVDPQWMKLLQEARRAAQGTQTQRTAEILQATELLRRLDLTSHSSLARALEQAAKGLFGIPEPGQAGVRLAYIAARSGARLPDIFRFRCRDGRWHAVRESLLTPGTADLPGLSSEWLESHTVSEEYVTSENASDATAWRQWAGTPNSRLRGFPLPIARTSTCSSRSEIENFINQRSGTVPVEYPLARPQYEIVDYDFDASAVEAWEEGVGSDPGLWATLCGRICHCWDEAWEATSNAEIRQVGYKNRKPRVDTGALMSAWLRRLYGTRCVRDEYGALAAPTELYRTTAETTHLRGFERFLHPDYDQPRCTGLLDRLGVRSRPDDVDRLIERVKVLAAVLQPPIEGLKNLYIAMDHSLPHLPTAKIEELRITFTTTALIYASDGGWHTRDEVYGENPDAIPDVPTVLPDLAPLRLWERLGVPARPTLDSLIERAKAIKPGTRLSAVERQRILSLLRWAPQMVWSETGCWLTAAGTWSAIKDLRWRSTSSELSERLFPEIRQTIAAVDMLLATQLLDTPLAELAHLERCLEHRPSQLESVGPEYTPPWMTYLASQLFCIVEDEGGQDAQAVAERRRSSARRLYHTHMQLVSELAMAPYLDGQMAGPQMSQQVLWHDEVLYVHGCGAAIHPQLGDELTKPFQSSKIRDAVRDCIDRPDKWIREYFDAHFDLNLTLLTELSGQPGRQDEPVETEEPDYYGTDLPPAGAIDAEDSAPETYVTHSALTSRAISGPPPDRPKSEDRDRAVAPSRRDRLNSYLQAQDFRYNAERGVYTRSDGTTIRHARDSFYPWQEERAGEIVAYYWVGDGSLVHGIEIPAEVWTLLVARPDLYRLLLTDSNGNLIQYTHQAYEQDCRAHKVDLFPATYRLALTEPRNR